MQVHKVVLTVIDFDGLGQQGVIEALENASYPNRCIAPSRWRAMGASLGRHHCGAFSLTQKGTA